MVDAPGDALKKTQVVKGIDEPYYLFAHAESLKESSWSEFVDSIKDHATQAADVAIFRKKRKLSASASEMIDRATEEQQQDVVNALVDRFSKKLKKTAKKKVCRCYVCGSRDHKAFDCPKRKHFDDDEEEKSKKKRKKKAKPELRIEDSEDDEDSD